MSGEKVRHMPQTRGDSAIIGSSTCKLCGQRFMGPKIQGVLIGSGPKTDAYMQDLGKHIAEQHPTAQAAIEAHGLAFMGMLRLLQFTTNDEGLKTLRDKFRWQIHQQTINVRIPEQKLVEESKRVAGQMVDKCIELASDGYTITATGSETLADLVEDMKVETARRLEEIIRSLRDLMEEPGKYPVAIIQEPDAGQFVPPA